MPERHDCNSENEKWVGWFRQVSPYINSHRNQTLVLALSGAAVSHPNLQNIIHDLALLNSLGVRLVVVFGARPQIDSILTEKQIKSTFYEGLRVTEADAMPHVLSAYGRLRVELEAELSMGVINSPMHGARIRVVSGNFVMARPIGVADGIDFGHTGRVRRIESQAIRAHLEQGSVVLIPALGYSVTGDVFNLSYEELAGEVAAGLAADKIVFMGAENGFYDENGALLPQLTVAAAENMSHQNGLQQENHEDRETWNQLAAAARACRAGVNRAHLLSYARDGALLEELFTRDGSGTLISADAYEAIRPAELEDVNGILELIKPLEQQGFLVRRSRERLETELDYFLVDVRDNAIIACAALYPFPEDGAGELSCFAVADNYRRKGRGDRLLEAIMTRARAQNFARVFALTTKTEQWFRERGFETATAGQLPGGKHYNVQRNAKVLVKHLDPGK